MSSFKFSELRQADLIVGARYCANVPPGPIDSEPLHQLMGVWNQGGIRYPEGRNYAVLYTTGDEPDWPDQIDNEFGTLTYFGDNKSPGSELHSKRGNRLLRDVYMALIERRFADIPPFFVFSRLEGRDVRFEGLAVPGINGTPSSESLSAIWRTKRGQPFQNYRASFTLLDVGVVERAWIDGLQAGQRSVGPAAFTHFAKTGRYRTRRAPRTISDHRTKDEQLPTGADLEMVEVIHQWFEAKPHAFEQCAIEIWRMLAPATSDVEPTPPSRDGGRDAIGTYSIGPASDRLSLDFILEAKCWRPDRQVGVKDTKRLISRLKHRQFGVFVTTSWIGKPAYTEVRQDGHPVAFVCAIDIVKALKDSGITTPAMVREWLSEAHPVR